MKTGDYVKLIKPNFTQVHGQSEPPKYWVVIYAGKKYQFQFGKVYKLTKQVKPVGNPEKGLINTDFAKKFEKNFKIVKK